MHDLDDKSKTKGKSTRWRLKTLFGAFVNKDSVSLWILRTSILYSFYIIIKI